MFSVEVYKVKSLKFVVAGAVNTIVAYSLYVILIYAGLQFGSYSGIRSRHCIGLRGESTLDIFQ